MFYSFWLNFRSDFKNLSIFNISLLLYRNESHFWMLILYPDILLNLSVLVVLGFSYMVSCHLHKMTILLFNLHIFYFFSYEFKLIWISFISLPWLLWLWHSVWYWIWVMAVGILVLFQVFMGSLSTFHCWVLYWPWICYRFYCIEICSLSFFLKSWINVEFCHLLFLHLLRRSCSFFFLLFCWCGIDCCIDTLIDLHMLSYYCDSGIN